MIDYGMFLMPVHDPAKPPGQCYDEDMELLVRSEELGFSEFWIGEHHSSSYENIVMPEIFIGKALGLDQPHAARRRARVPALPPSRPRGRTPGLPRSSLPRQAEHLLRSRRDPDRPGDVRDPARGLRRHGGRGDPDDHDPLDHRSALRHQRPFLAGARGPGSPGGPGRRRLPQTPAETPPAPVRARDHAGFGRDPHRGPEGLFSLQPPHGRRERAGEPLGDLRRGRAVRRTGAGPAQVEDLPQHLRGGDDEGSPREWRGTIPWANAWNTS